MQTTTTLNPKLRIGVLLYTTSVPAWTLRMLELIAASSHSELCLVVHAKCPQAEARDKEKFKDRLARKISELVYHLYMRSEQKRSVMGPDAFAPSDLSKRLAGLPEVDEKEIEKIRAHKLDVLLDLGCSENPPAEILKSARHGVWVFRHGGCQIRRGGPTGFWELFHGEPITGAALHVMAEDPTHELVLAQTYSATDIMTVRQSRNSLYWKALSLVPRQLALLHRIGHEAFEEKVQRENKDPRFYTRPHYDVPKNREFLPLLYRHFLKYVKRRLYFLFYFHQWILLFEFRDSISSNFSSFKYIVPPKDRFWTDPCVVWRDGKYHVFVEEATYTNQYHAHISVFTIDESGKHSVPERVLARPYHLSYPFVFQWQGVDYMIPDTCQNGAIELYRSEKFPGGWVLDRTLMGGIHAVDVTPFEHDGKWWIFANVIENEGASSWDELFLFYSDSPISTDWKPHQLNPVVSDVRRARPAGRVFRHGGELYRPGQDSGRSYSAGGDNYGSGMRIHRIVRLSETEYEEVEISRIEPFWHPDLVGTHTLSRDGRLTFIDAYKRRSRYFG